MHFKFNDDAENQCQIYFIHKIGLVVCAYSMKINNFMLKNVNWFESLLNGYSMFHATGNNLE